MLRAIFLASLVPFASPAGSVLERAPVPAVPGATAAAVGGGTIVQSGTVFTGVFEGSPELDFPLFIDGFSPSQGTLHTVEVLLDARMSGEYTIQPTPVPPNGIVESHSTTTLEFKKSLASVSLDFTPIPWVYPVNFPLNVLWAQDGNDVGVFTDGATLGSFTGDETLKLNAAIDFLWKVAPAGWADPHLHGVFATWEVRYHYD